jgi:DNA polymerase III alpha subunit
VSLFEDSGEKEFEEFSFEEVEDWPQKEKLRVEKELIGFYISGHPLDAYRKAFDRAATFDLRYPANAQKDKLYTIVGMIKSVRPYQTKTGKWMASAPSRTSTARSTSPSSRACGRGVESSSSPIPYGGSLARSTSRGHAEFPR